MMLTTIFYLLGISTGGLAVAVVYTMWLAWAGLKGYLRWGKPYEP